MCGATAGLAMMEGMIPLDVDGLLSGRALFAHSAPTGVPSHARRILLPGLAQRHDCLP